MSDSADLMKKEIRIRVTDKAIRKLFYNLMEVCPILMGEYPQQGSSGEH